MQREGAQTRGLALLLDFRGFGMRLLSAMRPADVKRGVLMLQDCFPARLVALRAPLQSTRWRPHSRCLPGTLARRRVRERAPTLPHARPCRPIRTHRPPSTSPLDSLPYAHVLQAILYILHEPRFLSAVFALLKPFLKNDALSQKIVLVGSNYARLREHLPSAAVPAILEAGGPSDVVWRTLVEQWLAEEEQAAAPPEPHVYFGRSLEANTTDGPEQPLFQ